MSGDPIPAVTEAEASGEIAAIFADLRTTLGVPFVNLIWRHLATMPGALPAIWARVKPLYGTLELEGRAADLRAAAHVPGIEPLPSAIWEGAGLDGAARQEIARLIDDYNLANSVNFLALSAATLVLGGELPAAGPSRAASRGTGRLPGPEPRPLPAMTSLAPSLQALVLACDGLGRLAPSEAHGSLYRHLAHWPAYLSLVYASLLAHDRSGMLQTAQRALIAEGRGIARDELLPLISTEPLAIDAQSRGHALASIEDFTGLMIGRMTVLGTAMRTLLG